MKIKFRDLYDTLKETRQYLNDMDVDIDNVDAGVPNCILSAELDRLVSSYMDLYNADITIDLNIRDLQREIELCMSCIEL
jgi:hypothetical protein